VKILVINSGSSSLKFNLIDMDKKIVLGKGIIERIGQENAILNFQSDGKKKTYPIKANDHLEAAMEMLNILTESEIGIIINKEEVSGVGHRIVHGGERFQKATLINEEVIQGIKEYIPLAPLHNLANLMGIDACRQILPNTRQVAVFDTSFHHTMPPYAYIYALPQDLCRKYGIRRYGFHGTSHKYVCMRLAELMGRKLEDIRVISCHLGNGASIAAIKNGVSVDTSMGMTPLEGLVMGTRSGDIDPAVPLFIMNRENMNTAEMDLLLNKRSGLLGISGRSNDMREILESADKGSHDSVLAVEVFCYRLKKCIGAYTAAMGGIDALIFTAGIGENSPRIRKMVLKDMDFLDIILSEDLNENASGESEISSRESRVKVWVIPTNEELMIANETVLVLAG